MTLCVHCGGYLLPPDEDGMVRCVPCGRVANAPSVDPTLYKGLKPSAPRWPPKPVGNPHPQRPKPRAWWASALSTPTGKTYVA